MTKEKIEAIEIYDTCKKWSHVAPGEKRVNDAKFRAGLIADKMIIEYDKIKDDTVPLEFILDKIIFWEDVKKEINLI